MIIETCTTDAVPQFMATSPPSRPSRRPRGGVAPPGELGVYHHHDAAQHNGIVVDTKAPKKTLKRPRRLSGDGDEKRDHFGLKKQRFATIEVDNRPQQPRAQARKGAVAKPTKTPAKHETLAERPLRDKEEVGATRELPRYAEKASNGIKHELERLQPDGAGAADTKSETRKLRSQEGTRFKSELASYFPDYDVVIGNEAAEETRKLFNATGGVVYYLVEVICLTL